MEKAINYLAFGDSLTVGFGAADGLGFVSLFKQRVEQLVNVPVQLFHAGTNGATTSELLETLESDFELQQSVQLADLITITAGGNDLLQAAIPFFYQNEPQYLKSALQLYETNYRKLLERIQVLREHVDTPYIIALVGLYNPLPLVPDAAYWVQRFNLFLRKLERPYVRIVQVYDAFVGMDGYYLAEDGIHPNEQGYEALSRQVENTVTLEQLRELVR
ncbi:SGNH/GDSL hydrolase family protein [Paenibacillus sp. SI8]|uniref:SGNH/GDSL hydrolase family protein n=1 Tax=unclassified Paenibacillus TaxID=185978 RepID=UPI003466DF1F